MKRQTSRERTAADRVAHQHNALTHALTHAHGAHWRPCTTPFINGKYTTDSVGVSEVYRVHLSQNTHPEKALTRSENLGRNQ